MKVPKDDEHLEEEEEVGDTDALIDENVESSRTLLENNPMVNCILNLVVQIQYYFVYHRSEFMMVCVLTLSCGLLITGVLEEVEGTHRRKHPNHGKGISHDFTNIKSSYELKLGLIDHWCLNGDNESCPRCDDPLLATSRGETKGWAKAHKKNMKMVEAYLTAHGQSANVYTEHTEEDYFADDFFVGDDLANSYFFMEDDGVTGGDDDNGDDDNDGDNNDDDDNDDDNNDDDDVVDLYDDIFDIENEHDFSSQNDHDTEISKVAAGNNYASNAASQTPIIDVVFLGDSITEARAGRVSGTVEQSIQDIKKSFENNFLKTNGGDFNGLALGIAGDTSPNLLWRIQHGEVPADLNPRVWWITIGANDLQVTKCSEDITLMGILRIVEQLQVQKPLSTIVINSILPISTEHDGVLEGRKVRTKDFDYWSSIKAINSNLEIFASKHRGIKYFDSTDIFTAKRYGKTFVRKDLMMDNLHPNLEGHKAWIKAQVAKLHTIFQKEEEDKKGMFQSAAKNAQNNPAPENKGGGDNDDGDNDDGDGDDDTSGTGDDYYNYYDDDGDDFFI